MDFIIIYKTVDLLHKELHWIASWLSTGHWTKAVPVSVAQNIELFTHALSIITIIFILDKEPKYRTVRLNTRHLATLELHQSKKYDMCLIT